VSGRIRRNTDSPYPGISDSVRVGAGDLLFVSGAIGFEDDGSTPDDFGREVELTLRGLERSLVAGGASFDDLVRVTVYITGLDQDRFTIYRAMRDRIIDTVAEPPASTVVGVERLFRGARIEIDAIAAPAGP
jgi:2-iminobutanoate/2-iminopropanoate deaminase